MRMFLAIVGCVILGMPSAYAVSEPEIQVRMERVVSDVIRPGFEAFANQAELMQDAAVSLCAQPDPAKLKRARANFTSLATAWAGVEFWRVGPLMQDNRLERVLFWPDRRGRGLRQVQMLLQQPDALIDLSPTMLSDKSVAVQGLMALEFSLFGTGSEALASTDGAARCAYVHAIAGNIAAIANALESDWQEDGKTVSLLLNPAWDNPLVRDSDEQIGLLLRLIRDGAEVMAVQRIGPIIRDDQSAARPKSALFWRSQTTIPVLLANLKSISAFSQALDVKPLLPADQARRADSLAFELANAKRTLDALNPDLSGIASNDGQYGRLNYLNIVMGALYALLEQDIPGVLGLVSGFSTLDGD